MSVYHYNAEAEALRRSITKPKGPAFETPSGTFPVRTDEGVVIDIPREVLAKKAIIVVASPRECKANEKFTYNVMVTNQLNPRLSADGAMLLKQTASTTAANVAKTVFGVSGLRAFGIGMGAGVVAGSLLGAETTGMGASPYHTVLHSRASDGNPVIIFVGGEKP